MAKGYAKWMCKVEGKEFPASKVPDVSKLTGEHLCFPDNIYDHDALEALIEFVVEREVGDMIHSTHLVDEAFEWSTHPLEGEWADFHASGTIAQKVYECCLWMKENWGMREVFTWIQMLEDMSFEVESIW